MITADLMLDSGMRKKFPFKLKKKKKKIQLFDANNNKISSCFNLECIIPKKLSTIIVPLVLIDDHTA